MQETNKEAEKIKQFALTLYIYPALMMTSPDVNFIELDFLDRLPFLIEKDPQLLQQAGWIGNLVRALLNAIAERNKLIESARLAATQGGGGLNFYQLESILQFQTSVAVSECVPAFQLFKQYLEVAESLNTVAKSYKVKGKMTMFCPPLVLAEAMQKLQEIFDSAVRAMPAAQ